MGKDESLVRLMDIKLGKYILHISGNASGHAGAVTVSFSVELKKPVEYQRNQTHKAWQQPMTKEQRELFVWADEVLTGAKPDNLCDLCFAPMGDKFKPGQENLCDRCRGVALTDWVEP